MPTTSLHRGRVERAIGIPHNTRFQPQQRENNTTRNWKSKMLYTSPISGKGFPTPRKKLARALHDQGKGCV